MAIYLAGQSKTTQHDGLSRFYFRQARQGRPPRQASDSSCPASFAAAALEKRRAPSTRPATHDQNGKVNYAEFAAFAQDRLADVAVDDINYTTRSHVDVGAIQAKAQAKIGA